MALNASIIFDMNPRPDAHVQLRLLTAADIRVVARLHLDAFPTFFLSSLGAPFLRELYRAYIDRPSAVAIVAEGGGGQILGALLGTCEPAGFFKRVLLSRWWAFGWYATLAAMRRPAIAPRLVRAVAYRGDAPAGINRALLSSIAVVPRCQGQGVGRRLVEEFVRQARERGCGGCFLTTDAEDNQQTNQFYRRLGWRVESSYMTPENRKMHRYVLDF